MALIVEARSHAVGLLCSASVDGKEVGGGEVCTSRRFSKAKTGNGTSGAMAPFLVSPRHAGALLSLRFKLTSRCQGGEAPAMEREVALPFARMVRLGAPLFASAVLGLPKRQEGAAAFTFEEAIDGARDPKVPKVVVTLFKPALPWGPGSGPPKPDVRGALMAVEEEGRAEACFGGHANANSHGPAVARQIMGVLEALQLAHDTTLSLGAESARLPKPSRGAPRILPDGVDSSTDTTTASEGHSSDVEGKHETVSMMGHKAHQVPSTFEVEPECLADSYLHGDGLEADADVDMNAAAHNDALEEEIQSMRHELEALRLKDKLQEDAKGEVVRLRTELEVLKVQERQHQYLQHEFSQMQMDLEALRVKERRHKDAEERYQQSQTELSEVRVTERRLQAELTQALSELQSCRGEERLRQELQDEVLRANTELGALKEKTRDYEGLKAELERVKAQLQFMHRANSGGDDADTIAELREELSRATAELQAMKINELRERGNGLRDRDQAEEIKMLYAKIEESGLREQGQSEEIKVLYAKIEESGFREQGQSEEIKLLYAKIEEMQADMMKACQLAVPMEGLDSKLMAVEMEKEALARSKEAAQKELEAKTEEAAQLRYKIKVLEDALDAAVGDSEKITDLRKKVAQSERAENTLQSELSRARSLLKKELETSSLKEEEHDRMQCELRKAMEYNEQLQRLHDDRTAHENAHAGEHDQVLQCAESKLAACTDYNAQLLEHNAQQAEQKAQLREENARQAEELRELESRIVGTEMELGQYRDLYMDSRAQLEKKEMQRREVAAAALAMKSELEEAQVEEQQLQNAQDDIVRMRNELTWGLDALQTRELQHQNLQSEVERARFEINELHLSEKQEVENARSEIDAMRQKEMEHQQKQAEVLRKCSELSALRLKHMHDDRATSEVHMRPKSTTLLRELDGLLMRSSNGVRGSRGGARSVSMSAGKGQDSSLQSMSVHVNSIGKERTSSRPPSKSPRTRAEALTPRGRRSAREQPPHDMQLAARAALLEGATAPMASVEMQEVQRLSPVPSSQSVVSSSECQVPAAGGRPQDGAQVVLSNATPRHSQLQDRVGAKKHDKLFKNTAGSDCNQQ